MPSIETEERTQRQSDQWLLDVASYTVKTKALELHSTTDDRRQPGHNSHLYHSGRRKLTFIRGIDIRLAQKPAAGARGRYIGITN